MNRYLTPNEFISHIGEDEARQIAGTGLYNTEAGSTIVIEKIEVEISFTDELISGYVLARHGWLNTVDIAGIPNLLKGLASDIVRYRLRDKAGHQGQVTEAVETRYKDAIRQLKDIQSGKLDLIRTQNDDTDIANNEALSTQNDGARISGNPTQSGRILAGYVA